MSLYFSLGTKGEEKNRDRLFFFYIQWVKLSCVFIFSPIGFCLLLSSGSLVCVRLELMFLEVILNGIGFPFQRIQLENYINFS